MPSQDILTVSVPLGQLEDLKARLRAEPMRILDAASGAINDTARHAKSSISKMIRDKVNMKKADVDKVIDATHATPENLRAVVRVSRTPRYSLRYFGAKQNAKGVTFQIAKNSGRTMVPGAFVVAKLGGQVFARHFVSGHSGKRVGRMPIVKLMGVSPWGVYVAAGMPTITQADAQAYLENRIRHRLLYAPTGAAG